MTTTRTVTLTGGALEGVGPPSARPAVAQLPQAVRLGRVRPAALPMVPRLLPFLDAAKVTPPPPSINRRDSAAASLARMYLNDQYGCCVISGKAHALGLYSGSDSDSGGEVFATDAEILAQYNRWKAGPGDSGCIITVVLDGMRSRGFTAGGKTYKLDGYVAVDNRDWLQTQLAQYVFGATTVGINLPAEWATSAVWDVTSSRIVGGHDVTPIDYDALGVYVSSWGRIYLMTWDAWTSTRYVEEYYALLAPLWYGADRVSPSGIDAAGLRAALDALSRGELPELPDVEPPPAPPTPTPGRIVELWGYDADDNVVQKFRPY